MTIAPDAIELHREQLGNRNVSELVPARIASRIARSMKALHDIVVQSVNEGDNYVPV